MISTVIIKPTKVCNADCVYCCAPPDGAPKWSFDDFRFFFDRLAPHLAPRAVLLWHGGEPMLMGPDFYRKALAHARAAKPEIRFSMQSNLLAYDSRRWKDVFETVFEGSLSTSYDPEERERTYKGDPQLYSRLFFARLDKILSDGFRPKVISTFTEETVPLADTMYDFSRAQGRNAFPIRFNYRYPAGRESGKGERISPETYGSMLLRIYDRWISEVPDFTITPLDEMLKKTIGLEGGRCPWTNACGGRFLGLEPNGDVYNCSEFADLGEPEYMFGNLKEMTVPELMRSQASLLIRRRRVDLPMDCRSCRHFAECEGGCMRDAVLYNRGLGGKFYYCASWKMVFDRIKESVRSGEADGAIAKYGLAPERVKESARRAAGSAGVAA